ncbi:MAG: TetR/AcrR family transcriptional regulator [Clostridia bacterium]|nr:TetR/AcrR family transcriptional regulator [Clostridia bacterium]MBO5334037.1 TetR/AcrR family transcriptional regulator [Clostridia bacterium]MBO5453472.1 TetR/AcrR family transcriptional regulator [Clostridia bacterium]
MINSIVKRHDRLNPFTEAQINVIRSTIKLFLQNGYSKTSIKMIEADCGVKAGNITYYFHSKEELLLVLVEELMDYHATMIEETQEKENDTLFAYAMEVAVQIALCENNRNAWDLYHSAYSLPQTYEVIKSWAAEKNYNLFRERLPDWTEHGFKEIEEVASGIELAALKSVCNRSFTLDKKISLFLNSLLMLYKVSEEERKKVIEKVLALDCERIAKEMFGKFVSRLDGDKQNE